MGEGINWKRIEYQGQLIYAADFLDGVLVDTGYEAGCDRPVSKIVFVPGWKVQLDGSDHVLVRRGPPVERRRADG